MLVAFSWHLLRSTASPVLPADFLRREEGLVLPFFPLQSIAAFFLGLKISRIRSDFGRTSAAHWIWIVPLAWVAVVILLHQRPAGVSRLSLPHHLRVISVLPFLTSACYAIGHAVGLRFSPTQDSSSADPK